MSKRETEKRERKILGEYCSIIKVRLPNRYIRNRWIIKTVFVYRH